MVFVRLRRHASAKARARLEEACGMREEAARCDMHVIS